jgi:CheY-like chemotaxis protein
MAERSPNQPCRILVVDDEPVVRDVIRNVLERPGLFLVDAADGEQAIELLLKEPFDILIADKNLPGITGLDVIRRAKAADSTIATLLITAYASRESVEEAMAIGVDDYLIKPFNIADLVGKVEEAQGRRASRQKINKPSKVPVRCLVMVCEPEAESRTVLEKALAKLGHKIIQATGLSEVLSSVRDKRVDAVICSLELLSKDSATACFLRSTLILKPAVRFVVVVSQRHLERAVEALRTGAGMVLYRPLGEPAAVADSLRGFLAGEAPKPATPSSGRLV